MFRLFSFCFIGLICLLAKPAGAISVLLPEEPGAEPLRMKSEIIRVEIDGPLVHTEVRQVFHNPSPRQREGTLVLSVPEGAQVTDFVMTINGEKVHGDVLEVDEARRIYTSIVRRMNDPGLLEYLDERTMKFRVFPIPANGDMPVELRFAQPLDREGGLNAFELRAPGRWPRLAAEETDLTLAIEWNAALGTVHSPTHELKIDRTKDGKGAEIAVLDYAPRDGRAFQLLFAPEEGGVSMHALAYRPSASLDGTFMLMIQPPPPGTETKRVPKCVVFVLDHSGSMANGKMDQARKALNQCLGMLGEEDTFNILAFATGVTGFREEPVPANEEERAAAREFLTGIHPRGGTNIEDALRRAVGQKSGDQITMVMFLTDGQPTVGVTDKGLIMKELESANTGDVRVFTLGVGYEVNTHLLDALSQETRALSSYIEPDQDIELTVSNLFDSISYPVMTGLELSFEGIRPYDVYPTDLPDLFAGNHVTVYGRCKGEGNVSITLKGETADGQVKQSETVVFPDKTGEKRRYVAALWANRKVAYLLDEIRRNGESKELRDEVVALAEEYNLVTPYTSYLVVEEHELPGLAMMSRPTPSPGAPRVMMQGTMSPPHEYDPAEGTVSAGDVWRTQARRSRSIGDMAEETGASSVQAAKEIGERKQATSLANIQAPGERTVRRVGTETFVLRNGVWSQRDIANRESLETVRVKYLSDAYFALLERFEDQTGAITLGERVELVLCGYLVAIGEDGLEKEAELPEKLRS